MRISCRALPPMSNTEHLTASVRLRTDSKNYTPREGAASTTTMRRVLRRRYGNCQISIRFPGSHGINSDTVGTTERVAADGLSHRAVGAHAEHPIRTRMQHVADVVEPDARIGDVERAAQADHDVVQEHRPELAQAHRVDRGTRLR